MEAIAKPGSIPTDQSQEPDLDPHAVGPWLLTPAEYRIVVAKKRPNQLGFALMIHFFRTHGRFPKSAGEIAAGAAARIAQQLGMKAGNRNGLKPAFRTAKRYRAEIRALFGFRTATVADSKRLRAWLCDQVVRCEMEHARLAMLLGRTVVNLD